MFNCDNGMSLSYGFDLGEDGGAQYLTIADIFTIVESLQFL